MIHMVFELTGVWFWFTLLAIFCFSCFLDYNEKWILEFWFWLIAIFVLVSFTNVNPFPWIWEHKLLSTGCVLGYVVIATCWAVAKWYLFCHNALEDYQDNEKRYQRDWLTNVAGKKYSYKDWLAAAHKNYPPLASQNKNLILAWMGYWPASFVQSLFGDILRRLWVSIYNELLKVFSAISGHVFRDVNLADPTPPPTKGTSNG